MQPNAKKRAPKIKWKPNIMVGDDEFSSYPIGRLELKLSF